ncbi:metal-sulfur cluster assembly factor [Nitriliruptor alkaliphilus]|uniref:metal-sulfur cluster assembly factor n=1 Tax=Nitriliruptor alkaliphilus TaxID=427918 RepID=UPI000699207A|nr:metal-sulfur cluster assembly factor [Nitriliruptor alkaliphilus]
MSDQTDTTTREPVDRDALGLDDLPEADTESGAPEAEATTGAPDADETPAPSSNHPFADLPLEEDGMPASQDLMNGLRAVVDPEIGYNIVDLGLVYEVTKPERGYAHVRMTLTSMGCPLTEVIHQQCSVILGAMPGVDRVEVEFTFTPPWDTSMIADYVREEMRAMGMNV